MNEDHTRKMLKLIREAEIGADNDSYDLSTREIEDDVSVFVDIANTFVVDTFKIYPDDNNVIMTGRVTDFGDFVFQMSLESDEAFYITTSNLSMSKDVSDTLYKLRGEYTLWKEEWQKKIKHYKTDN